MNERRLPTRLLAAAAAIAVIASAGVFIATRDDGSSQTDIATDVTVEDSPTTTVEDSTGTTARSGTDELGFPLLDEGTERRCYVDFVSGESRLVVELSDNGSVRSASLNKEGELSELGWGAEFGAPGWFVVNVEPRWDESADRYTAAWFITGDGVSQAEDVGYESVACSGDDPAMLATANNVALATPQPVGDPLLTTGQRCFINDTNHPGLGAIRLDVEADGSIGFVGRTEVGGDASIVVSGTGYFATDTALAFDITTVSADPEGRSTEIYTLEEAGLRFGLGFFNEEVDCSDPAFAELDAN